MRILQKMKCMMIFIEYIALGADVRQIILKLNLMPQKHGTGGLTMLEVRYSVWDNRNDQLVLLDGTAEKCADAMGVTVSSFRTIATKCKQGDERRWHVETNRKENFKTVKRKCDRCGKTYMAGKYSKMCPECRSKQLSELASKRFHGQKAWNKRD